MLHWTLVVPLKPLLEAKSRLAGTADDTVRPGLALAFAEDTVAAALACPRVADVVVVTNDARADRALSALGARVVPDGPAAAGRSAGEAPAAGLNAAFAHAAAVVRTHRPDAALAALNADLPALRPGELARVLAAAAEFPRAFLADAASAGTTLLTAAPGAPLCPAFGGASRARHAASGAVELMLPDVASVRLDVDTGDDLRAALSLGVGPRTAAEAARLLIEG